MKRLFSIIMCIALLSAPGMAMSEDGPESVSAASAILIEPHSGRILYEKNSRESRPIASTTKIMTALVAVQLCEPEEVVCVQPDCVKIEGTSLYLEENEQLTMADMLYGLLLRSGNDAAAAIGKYCAGDVDHFVSLMNRKAWELGMTDTNFANPHGLDQEGHYSSARDMALAGAEFMRAPLLRDICMCDEYISRELSTGKVRLFRNNNKLLIRDPRAIGIKIGWTDNAGRCLVAAARVGEMELIAVVLDAPDLYCDVSKLFDYGFGQLKMQELIPQGKVMTLIPVARGNSRRVPLTVAESVNFPVFPDESVSFSVHMELPERVEAPIQIGQPLGTARVLIDGSWEIEVDLVATSEVQRKTGLWAKMFGWIRGWRDK